MSSDDSSINPDDVPLEVEDINIIPPFKMEYNMNDFEKKLKKLDYEIMEFNPNDTIDVVETDLAIYKECMKIEKHFIPIGYLRAKSQASIILTISFGMLSPTPTACDKIKFSCNLLISF